jgi:hypothetical protein
MNGKSRLIARGNEGETRGKRGNEGRGNEGKRGTA